MEQPISPTATVKDPVCGMDVRPGHARGWDYLFETAVYHFCGPECRTRFAADPHGILAFGPGKPVASALAGDPNEKFWWHPLRDLVKKGWSHLSG